MHVSVIGHSDSIGLKLEPGEDSWPVLLGKMLSEELNEPVPVDSWRFAAYGPHAVPWAIGKVTAAQPDVVVIMVSSYWCAFGRVSNKVRQRFGQRAERWYLRAEDGFVKHAEREHGTGKPTNTRTRRFMRRVVGVSAYAGLEEVTDVFTTVVRKLAQLEHLQVILVSDHHFTEAVRQANAGILPTLAHFEAVIRPIANEHRFLWLDIEDALKEGGRREEMVLGDGVHLTAEAHARVAAMLMPVVRRIGQAGELSTQR
ncbi:MAG TPA: SGNH/GDSL hydrolase family protein [Tepidiformaceae bacterium]|nr:SGNH/GDSL hydrolase family protein [Tepidiformaceae bacterium]